MSLSYQGIGARLNLNDEQVQIVNVITGGFLSHMNFNPRVLAANLKNTN